MTRNIRKIVSILCAVAILLSLCAVSFIGSSSAAVGNEDNITVQNVWQTDKVELDLTFDGATPGGIPLATSSTKKYENGAFVYGNNGGGMGAAWLGKDASVTTISTSTSYTTANSPKANLFQLKANTTYKVTYKIAYRNDAPQNLEVQWMAAIDPYLSSNHGRADGLITKATMIDGVDIKAPAPAGGTGFGDWQEETLIFTMGNADKYLGLRQNSASGGEKIFKFDYIKIESGSVLQDIQWNALDNEYVIDYTDASNQAQLTTRMEGLYAGSYANAHYSWYNWNNCMVVDYNNATFVNSTTNPGKPGFTAEGMKFNLGKGQTIAEQPTFSTTWASNAPIYDPDVGYADTNNGYIRLRDNAAYIITVKYKVTEIQGAHVNFSVAAINSAAAGAASILPGSLVTHYKDFDGMNEWQTITTAIDTAANESYADKILTLTGSVSGDAKWATIIVDSITVKEKRDPQNGVAIVETYNDGAKTVEFATPGVVHTLDVPDNTEDKGFAGWYTRADYDETTKVDIANFKPQAGTTKLYAKWVNTVCKVTFNVNGVKETKKVAVGEALPRAERPNANLFFEGWYADIDFTDKITEVPEVGACELFAKFTGIYLPFDNGGYKSGTGEPELIVDPDDAENKVLKFSAGNNSRPNFYFTALDDTRAGKFALETNTTYYYSFRVKAAPESSNADITFYQGADPTASGERTSLFVAGNVGANTTDKNSEWTTYSGSFTTKDTFYLNRVNWAYQDRLYFTIYPGNGDTNKNDKIDEDETAKQITVYIDDFMVYKALEEAPEGATTISFNTNGPVLSDLYGFAGEKLTLPTPELGGYKFIGWYSDKKLTAPYTATTFGSEDVVLYAKWETTDFVVDFENYNESGTLSRAKVLNVDGNWLMDYKSEYSTLTDYNTLYRAHVNKGGVLFQVSEGVEYTVSFDYKLTRGTLKYGAVTNGRFNGWANYYVQKNAGTITALTDEWKTVTFKFTVTNPDKHKENWNFFALGLGGDCDAQIDNVKIIGSVATANLYGSIVLNFIPNEGKSVQPVSGEPGEAIGALPTTSRPGYLFNGWYADAELTTPFTAKTFAEENMTAYAGWLLGKFNESYEEYPNDVKAKGISGGYSLYNSSTAGFDKANVQSGSTSLFRNGTSTGTKAVTLCRDEALMLTVGKQYTLNFYVKPTNVTAADGTINIIGLKTNTGIATPENTDVVTKVGDLKAGEWQKVSYTFTAKSQYLAISTTAANDMYLDNFTVTLKGYTGTTTGDSSVSPIILCLMVVLAAGSLVVTGKKVFEK